MTGNTRTRRSTPRPSRSAGKIGYGRPPVEHRFKPGQSGNRSGRPKGAKNETTIMRSIMNRKVEVRENGRSRSMPLMEAMLLRFAEDALKGNPKAAAFLLNRYGLIEPGDAPADQVLSEDDQHVLEAFALKLKGDKK